MSLIPDKLIKSLIKSSNMIEPFIDKQVSINEKKEKIISYGLSSYGYDARVSNNFKIFTNIQPTIIDPKNFDKKILYHIINDFCIIPPNSFALAKTVEYFRIPKNIFTICVGKSTYARCGVIINVTPLEPEWEGYVTLEISNTTNSPVKIHAEEGICQFIFFSSSQECDISYANRDGKYMKQDKITLPFV